MLAQAPASVNPLPSNVAKFPVLTIPAVHAIRDAKLGGYEKAVLNALASRLPTVRPSVATICQDCGFGRSKVLAVLRALEERGMVRRIRLGGRYGTNAYELDLEAIQRARQGSPPRTQGSVSWTSEGSVLRTQRDKGEKRQEEKKRAFELPEGEREEDRGGVRGEGRDRVQVPEVAPPSSVPSTSFAPFGEPVQDQGGDRLSELPPPASGRFDLPDVSTPEPAIVDREVEAMKGRRDRGEPMVSTSEHLVAAFDAGHRAVYGFSSPAVRGPKLWKCAVTAVRRLVGEVFKGDVGETDRYLCWAWTREQTAMKGGKRRDRPIGWQLMFGPMVADYLKYRRERERRAA